MLDVGCWPKESDEKLPDRSKHRLRRPLEEILRAAVPRNQALEKAMQPCLVKEEIVAANLYTGPVRTRPTSSPTLPDTPLHARSGVT
jgi:hypothetical protein